MGNIFVDIIDKEYEVVCQLYWQVEENGRFSYSMIKIEEKTQLKPKEIKAIVAKSCKAYCLKLKCVACGEIESLRDRNHFSHLSNFEHTCIDCIRIDNEKERQQKIEYINDLLFFKKENALSINELSFENSVFLLAIIRCCADENLMYLDSLDNKNHEKLTPSHSFDLLIIEQLYTAGVISVSSVTDLKYLSVSEDYICFNNMFMCWDVIIKETDSLSSIIDLLEEKITNIDYLHENKNELIELCKKNNLFECFFLFEL